MEGLSVLVHHFISNLYTSTRIDATSMLVSLLYASLKLLETCMQAGFSVDTNLLAQTCARQKLDCNSVATQQMGHKNRVQKNYKNYYLKTMKSGLSVVSRED